MRFFIAAGLLLVPVFTPGFIPLGCGCSRERRARPPAEVLDQAAAAADSSPGSADALPAERRTLLPAFKGRLVQLRVTADPSMTRWVSVTRALVEEQLRTAGAVLDNQGTESMALELSRSSPPHSPRALGCVAIRSTLVAAGREFLPGHTEVARCGGALGPATSPGVPLVNDGLVAIVAAVDASVRVAAEAIKREEPPEVVAAYSNALAETLLQLNRKQAVQQQMQSKP